MPCGWLAEAVLVVRWSVRSSSGRLVFPVDTPGSLAVEGLVGLWLDETEGAKFWLSCLTDLKKIYPAATVADSQGDLHHQRNRVGQQRESQIHAQSEAIPQQRFGVEADCQHSNRRGFADQSRTRLRNLPLGNQDH